MDEVKKVYEWLLAIPKDKLLHVVVGGALTALLGLVMGFGGQLLIMSFVFFGKEVFDKVSGKGTPEWGDLVADYIGFLIAVI